MDVPIFNPNNSGVKCYSMGHFFRFVATGTYYGLTLVSTHLAGDRFVNFALSGVFEAPALILGLYLYNR